MKTVWIIEVIEGHESSYFAGWDDKGDADLSTMRSRALEYSYESEALEDSKELDFWGYNPEVFETKTNPLIQFRADRGIARSE